MKLDLSVDFRRRLPGDKVSTGTLLNAVRHSIFLLLVAGPEKPETLEVFKNLSLLQIALQDHFTRNLKISGLRHINPQPERVVSPLL